MHWILKVRDGDPIRIPDSLYMLLVLSNITLFPYCKKSLLQWFVPFKTSQSNDWAGSRQGFIPSGCYWEMAVCSVWLVPFRADTLSLMSCSYSLIFFFFFSEDDSRAWCFVFVYFGSKVHFRFLRWTTLQKDSKYLVINCLLVLFLQSYHLHPRPQAHKFKVYNFKTLVLFLCRRKHLQHPLRPGVWLDLSERCWREWVLWFLQFITVGFPY